VRVLGLVGGVGPWRVLEPPSHGAEDRACLALLDAGDVAAAWDCFQRDVDAGRARQTPSEAALDIIGGEASDVATDPAYRDLWTENMRIVLSNTPGYIFDNVAWGRVWDVDPRDVTSPAFLFYGSADRHCSADGHGRWYADRIANHELVVLPDAAHFEVIDGHWPEVLDGLLRIWS
jgi:hypothetical protein